MSTNFQFRDKWRHFFIKFSRPHRHGFDLIRIQVRLDGPLGRTSGFLVDISIRLVGFGVQVAVGSW